MSYAIFGGKAGDEMKHDSHVDDAKVGEKVDLVDNPNVSVAAGDMLHVSGDDKLHVKVDGVDMPEVGVPNAELPSVDSKVPDVDMKAPEEANKSWGFGIPSMSWGAKPNAKVDINADVKADVNADVKADVNADVKADAPKPSGFFPNLFAPKTSNADVKIDGEAPKISSPQLNSFLAYGIPKVHDTVEYPKVNVKPKILTTNVVAPKPEFDEEIEKKAAEITFFVVDAPKSQARAIADSEYNIAKGAIMGTSLLIMAPWVGAVDEACKRKTALSKISGGFEGFGSGIYRGVSGGSALWLTGAITGGDQFYKGIVKAPEAPGQGRGLYGNWSHVVNSSYCDLAANVEPESFASELQELLNEGLLPARDSKGDKIPYDYSFFMVAPPEDIVDGIGGFQYNIVKGAVAGTTMLVCAPWKEAYDRYHRLEKDGRDGGIEGAVRGFGQGLGRGVVGGTCLIGAGAAYGTFQLVRSIFSFNNFYTVGNFLYTGTEDMFCRIPYEPVPKLILPKGYGLEQYLMEEKLEAKLQKEKEEFKKKREEYAEAKVECMLKGANADPKATEAFGTDPYSFLQEKIGNIADHVPPTHHSSLKEPLRTPNA